jgi:hypothetical protein
VAPLDRSSVSPTAIRKPVEYVGTVAQADIDLRSRRFRFAYDDPSTVPASFVAMVTDQSGSSSEVSAGCVGITALSAAPSAVDFDDRDGMRCATSGKRSEFDVDRNGPRMRSSWRAGRHIPQGRIRRDRRD